jgi:hypothetical protein
LIEVGASCVIFRATFNAQRPTLNIQLQRLGVELRENDPGFVALPDSRAALREHRQGVGSSVSSTVFSIRRRSARYYAKLAAQTAKSDCSRDELSDVRKFIVAERVDRSR